MVFQTLIAIQTFYNLNIDKIDIKTAFLHNLINQPLYVEVL